MVVGAFPLAKLGALVLRQVSKPIANYAKEKAKQSPFFRTYICMPPAQFYNWCEVKMKMWVMNLGRPIDVPHLNEAMAIELGANLLGESIIFVIAAGLLISEYVRSVRKENAKEAAQKEEMANLHGIMNELYFQAERQDAQIRELNRVLTDIQCKVHSPWKHGSHLKPDPSLGSRPSETTDVSLHNVEYEPSSVTNALHYISTHFLNPGACTT